MPQPIVKKFGSPLEFLEWATNAPTPWKGELHSRRKGNKSWAGTDTYEEAYNMARFGWPEGLERLVEQVELAAKFNPEIPNRKRRYDVAGNYPDAARAALGNPFSMVSKGRDFRQKPVIKIRTNYGYLANVDSDTVIKWGAAMCSYINNLERAGFSTQLDAFEEGKAQGGPSISFQFPLKQAGEPLQLANVVFWWGNPAALRRITFSAIERLDIESSYSSGYGTLAIVEPIDKESLFLDINDARGSIKENLDVIISKHKKLLEGAPNQGVSNIISDYNHD